jgi:hypothetical protein
VAGDRGSSGTRRRRWCLQKEIAASAIIVGLIEIGTVRFNQKVRPPQSARGLAHSKTLRELEKSSPARSVLDCGGPPPLFQPATFQIMPMLN